MGRDRFCSQKLPCQTSCDTIPSHLTWTLRAAHEIVMIKPDATLPTRVAQSLLQRIISDEFPPGTILPSERELQEEYQVSRAVVREAMKLLASRKLLSISHGQGAVVTSDFTEPVMDALLLAFHQSDIRAEDIYNVRRLLEPQSAELAAHYATLPQIRRLTDLAASFDDVSFHGSEEVIRESLKRWGNLDREFHQLLAESSQNAVLGILITVIVGIVWNSISINMPTPSPERFSVAVRQHQAIAAAVARRDGQAARQAMSDHIETSLRNVVSPEDRVLVQVETLI